MKQLVERFSDRGVILENFTIFMKEDSYSRKIPRSDYEELYHMCFDVNFAKFIGTNIYQKTQTLKMH